jgi:hypothetical protein
MANATEDPVGRSASHERAVFMATGGHFCWPPAGTNYWPLTEARQPRFVDPMIMISERPPEIEDRAVPGAQGISMLLSSS